MRLEADVLAGAFPAEAEAQVNQVSDDSEAIVAVATTHMLAACLGRMHGAVAGFWSLSERLCGWPEFEGYAARRWA